MRRIVVLVAVIGAVGAGVWLTGSDDAPQAATPAMTDTSASDQKAAAGNFDSNRAWEHLRQLVSIGPRHAGSPGMRQQRAYITRQISDMGLQMQEQTFTADTPQGRVEMVNLIVRLPGKRPEKILLTGHYDTKFFKDQVFVGANDGGSSAAFLIELARVLKDKPREFTYEIVWFDGEEAFCLNWDDCGKPGNPDNTYGSRYYVRAAQDAKALASLKAMILVDMIADRNLVIQRELDSTTWLKDIIWGTAKRLGHGNIFRDSEMAISDDHIPFLKAGVPAVDIIDLDYIPWHHQQGVPDTLEHVSARGLQVVGDVLVAALPEIEKRLLK